ncbi:MAG: glycosyltransferase [Prevotella sp.]|nr:glycosyltransferase [Prevotella sp.]
MMTRVLEVIRQGQIGGGESHLLDLVRFLDREAFEPVCLSFTGGEMINRLHAMGIRCRVIATEKPFDINVQRQIKQLMQAEHIQLVHAHGSRAASNVVWPARSLHLPLIYTVHGWSFHDDQSALVKRLRAYSEKVICHYSDAVVCVSQSNADTGRKVFGLKACHVIENGINLERFNPAAQFADLRQAMHFAADDFVVGFIARCTKQKNPLGFLQALETAHRQEPRIKGLFVGEGDMDQEVDAFIASHRMEGYLHRTAFRTDVPDLLHAVDVYCLPSLWEGLSIALLEAMAMAKVIIATPTDGTSEVIRHEENGLIVSFNNPQALAAAITTLAASPAACTQYGRAARSIVEQRFNAQRVADAVAGIYRKCLG